MNEQIRRCAIGLLALGLVSGSSLAAAAQDIDDDGYVVEERSVIEERTEPTEPTVELDDDDDDEAMVVAQRDGMQRCAATFRSFDSRTGTYVTYDGETRTCPYLE